MPLGITEQHQGYCAWNMFVFLFLKILPNYGHEDIKTKEAHSLPHFQSTEDDPKADLDFLSDSEEN